MHGNFTLDLRTSFIFIHEKIPDSIELCISFNSDIFQSVMSNSGHDQHFCYAHCIEAINQIRESVQVTLILSDIIEFYR